MASLTDALLTPNRSDNFLSEGSFSPGFKIPFFIWLFGFLSAVLLFLR